MGRLIDADALQMEPDENGMMNGVKFIINKRLESRRYAIGLLKTMINNAPTVEAEPVRHGHNENQEYHEVDEFSCSECGLHLEDWTRYVYDEDSDEKYAQEYVFKRCPECGAKIGVQ